MIRDGTFKSGTVVRGLSAEKLVRDSVQAWRNPRLVARESHGAGLEAEGSRDASGTGSAVEVDRRGI